MISNEEIEKVTKGWIALNIIWAGMLIFQVSLLFVFLLFVVPHKDKINISFNKEVIDVLRIVFYTISFITLIATKYIRKFILSGKMLKKFHQDSKQNTHPVRARYTIAMIIALAMSDSIGVDGFLLFLISKNQLDLYLLVLISIAAIIYYCPKKKEVISMLKDSK